jgi:hypothetical protein
MTPLWMRANLPSLLTWGWALASVTPPWVAQLVCPRPTVPVRRTLAASLARFSTRPDLLDDLDPAVLDNGEPRGVISAVFKAL